MKKILIVGGAGFAGSHLAQRLLEKGDQVCLLDIIPKPHSDFIETDVEYKWKAMQDVSVFDIVDYDIVVHLAAQADVPMGFHSPLWTCYQNVYGTIALLDAVRQAHDVKKCIIAGSGSEIGRPLYMPIDEAHPLTPANVYGWSKASEELAGWTYYRSYDVPTIIASNGIVTGPGMRREVFIFKWLYNILKGKPVVLEGGDQTRDVTYISDVIDALTLIINAPEEDVVGEKFQISYGTELSVEAILDICMDACNKKVEIIYEGYRPGENGQRENFDNSKAKRILGYSPQVDPIKAIKLTAQWIEKEVLQCG